MKILVTGATGCLGGVARGKLAALGHAVTGLGRDAAKGADLERSAIRFDSVDLGDARRCAGTSRETTSSFTAAASPRLGQQGGVSTRECGGNGHHPARLRA